MPNDGFCNACQMMLCGKSEPSGTETESGDKVYLHHRDAKSFEQALELQCPSCVRIWAGMGSPSPLAGTKFIGPLPKLDIYGHGTYKIDFFHNPQDAGESSSSSTDDLRHAVLHLILSDAMKKTPDQALLSSSTGSDSALKFLTSKLEKCWTSHAQCRLLTRSTGYLPTRLIDVGESGDALVSVRERSDLIQGSSYVALSHCWGGTQPITLTAETATMLRTGATVQSLPQTFQDAVFLCRKLGFRYVWIDSLCIFQDNLNDWAIEARHMKEIYSNAIFAIAATAAKDSDAGLFYHRNPVLIPHVQVEIAVEAVLSLSLTARFLPPGTYFLGFTFNVLDDITTAPLNTRA
ncbi:hypothetical protein M3J09_001997 [Ascochyta lentis]